MPRPLYPWGKSPRYPLNKRLCGLQIRCERRGEEKILEPTVTRTPTSPSFSPYPVAIRIALSLQPNTGGQQISKYHLKPLYYINIGNTRTSTLIYIKLNTIPHDAYTTEKRIRRLGNGKEGLEVWREVANIYRVTINDSFVFKTLYIQNEWIIYSNPVLLLTPKSDSLWSSILSIEYSIWNKRQYFEILDWDGVFWAKNSSMGLKTLRKLSNYYMRLFKFLMQVTVYISFI
jgi:hypothetical protein